MQSVRTLQKKLKPHNSTYGMQGQAVQHRHSQARSQKAVTQLTLHQIAPRWASVLGRTPKTDKFRFKIRGKNLDLSQLKMCVVGEAHGFDESYDECIDCYQTSLEFSTLLRDSPYERKAQLDHFVTHFNSKHL